MNEAIETTCGCNPCSGTECACGCQGPAIQETCGCGAGCACGELCGCGEKSE